MSNTSTNPKIAARFSMILNLSDAALKLLIDTYNQGLMSKETRLALEAIEAMVDEEEQARKDKEFRDSLNAYLELYAAGFRITNSKMGEFGGCEINRFWWNGKVIRSFPDIDKIQGEWNTVHFNTIHDGRVEKLS